MSAPPPDPRSPLRDAARSRLTLAILCLCASLAVFPRWLAGRDADAYFDGDVATQAALADGVARAVSKHPRLHFYETGDARFDGQSAIAIYQMTIMGLAQVVLEHPERRENYVAIMEKAAQRLVDLRTLAYAARVYGDHGVARMQPAEGHAYLGYINLGLGMLRAVHPETPLAALHDRLSDALAERLTRAPNGLIETYPGETWPPDVAAVAGSVGLHASVTGKDRRAMLALWAERFRTCAVHASGYLVQRVRSGSCEPVDAPRGSGTAVAAYFIAFADRELARSLHTGLEREGERSFLGFSALREYAAGFEGQGDVNAGPVIFGVSVGATGFGLGSARMHEDRELFRRLFRTAAFFGAPTSRDGTETFALGGTLGNALILAMLTARLP